MVCPVDQQERRAKSRSRDDDNCDCCPASHDSITLLPLAFYRAGFSFRNPLIRAVVTDGRAICHPATETPIAI
jgi:hypothetical protein